MIQGEVNADREAVIHFHVFGANGIDFSIDAVIDTGFTEYLTLPSHQIAALALPYQNDMQVILADGSNITVPVFTADVLWDGLIQPIPVHEADGGPLVGMSLLYGSRLTVDIVDGGQMTIEALP